MQRLVASLSPRGGTRGFLQVLREYTLFKDSSKFANDVKQCAAALEDDASNLASPTYHSCPPASVSNSLCPPHTQHKQQTSGPALVVSPTYLYLALVDLGSKVSGVESRAVV